MSTKPSTPTLARRETRSRDGAPSPPRTGSATRRTARSTGGGFRNSRKLTLEAIDKGYHSWIPLVHGKHTRALPVPA